MTDQLPGDFHKLHPDEYEIAEAEAAGAFTGWLAGNGIEGPRWTAELTEAFRRATAAAFNRGYHTALTGGTQP